MKKIVMGAAALAAILGTVLFLNLGSAVKTVIETAGTNTLGTPVRVSGLKVSLADRAAKMSGLSIANPEGFKSPYLLKTDHISVTGGTLEDNVVTINEIVIDGMQVTYELGGKGTNFKAIQKNLKSGASTQKSSTSDSKDNPKVVIKKLRIVNAQLIPALAGIDKKITLPEITLENIGSAKRPASIAQVTTSIMGKVMATSSKAVAKAGLQAPADSIKGKVTDTLKGLF